MNLYGISLICFSFGVILIGCLVLIKRKDGTGRRFFAFSIFVSLWSFFGALWMSQSFDQQKSLLFMRVSDVFAVFIPITWAHFVFNFIGKKEPFRFFYAGGYVLAGALMTFSFSPQFIPETLSIMEFQYYIKAGPVYHVFSLMFFLLVPYVFIHLIQAYFKAENDLKYSLKYLLWATVVGFTAGGLTFPPMYGIPVPQYLIGIMPLYPLLMGIALIRYGLFEVSEIADAFQREKMAVLGTMAASLNHEIRNPLFVIKGKAETYIDALERKKYITSEEFSEASRSAIQPILNQATRGLEIIQRFTDFARPFSVKAPRERVVLREVFQDVQELISSELQRGEIHLSHNLTNGLAVYANRRHIEEILSNLVMNACHAIGETGGQVTVNAESDGRKIKLEVSDSGLGITRENLPKVFEPFFTTKGSKGTGLGLYITKQLVEQNSGKIFVKSKLGIGTTFSLEFKQ